MASKFNFGINKDKEDKSIGEKALILENKNDFDFRQIEFEKIIPNEKNFYSISNIEELAKSISEYGLLHNIAVLESDNEEEKKFKIISGERRYRAIEFLRNNGNEIKTIPCKVIRNVSEVVEEIMLLKGNSDTRDLTDDEKRIQVQKLRELYEQKASIEGVKVKKKDINDQIASDMNLSAKQVERYNHINEGLIPQLKDYFDNKKITFNEAIKFARLDEQMQLAILDLLQEKDKISDEELDIIKKENKKLVEDNKVKDKVLQEKEKLIHELEDEKSKLEIEKNELEDEKERNTIELESIEEEKKKLEATIKEEMAKLSEEELNNLKEKLREAESKAESLSKVKGELEQQLKDKEEELENKSIELEENIEHNNVEPEEKQEVGFSKEQLEKAVAQEKFKDLKDTIVKSIVNLGDLAKKTNCESLEVAEEVAQEIERALKVYRNKISKLSE